jgi:hypothetical protein
MSRQEELEELARGLSKQHTIVYQGNGRVRRSTAIEENIVLKRNLTKGEL